MPRHSPKDISQLLLAWGEGDEAALEQLAPLVHEELERQGHTLQTSALVNEAYIRLIDGKNARWQNHAQVADLTECRSADLVALDEALSARC